MNQTHHDHLARVASGGSSATGCDWKPGYGADNCHFDTRNGLLYHDFGPLSAEANPATLIYVPGVQGDWTPLHGLGRQLARRYRLILTAYPRRPEWSLADHSRALIELMDRLGIRRAHLLAESFGSLVAWQAVLDAPARVDSMLIAGGFCQPPFPFGSRFADRFMRVAPCRLFSLGVDCYVYALTARWSGTAVASFRREAFPAARSPSGMLAAANRFRLISQTDLRPRLREARTPITYLGGGADLVVPVRREVATLARELHADCRFHGSIIPRAPHAILPARPADCSGWVDAWIQGVASIQA